MPRQTRPRSSPTPTPLPPPPTPPALTLTAEQVNRWAELIADGRDQFPADLPEHDRGRLLAAVRRRRHDRLVQHIARAIALDLRGAAQPE